jgi:hypothetical protein
LAFYSILLFARRRLEIADGREFPNVDAQRFRVSSAAGITIERLLMNVFRGLQ